MSSQAKLKIDVTDLSPLVLSNISKPYSLWIPACSRGGLSCKKFSLSGANGNADIYASGMAGLPDFGPSGRTGNQAIGAWDEMTSSDLFGGGAER
jgi:hypothetical protein